MNRMRDLMKGESKGSVWLTRKWEKKNKRENIFFQRSQHWNFVDKHYGGEGTRWMGKEIGQILKFWPKFFWVAESTNFDWAEVTEGSTKLGLVLACVLSHFLVGVIFRVDWKYKGIFWFFFCLLPKKTQRREIKEVGKMIYHGYLWHFFPKKKKF